MGRVFKQLPAKQASVASPPAPTGHQASQQVPEELSFRSRSHSVLVTKLENAAAVNSNQPGSYSNSSSLSSVSSPSIPHPQGTAISSDVALKLAQKFRFIYCEFVQIARRIGLDKTITLNVGSYPAFAQQLEAAENKKTAEALERVAPPLVMALLAVAVDLRTLMDGVDLSANSLSASNDTETLRLSYFAFYSLLIEAVALCRMMAPGLKMKRRQQPSLHKASSSLSGLPRSISQVRTLAVTGRVPAASANAVPARQQINRPPLKVDTTLGLNRQDSDFSMASANQEVTDDDKLYELIGHTIQASQVVFSQLNSAISKSAINTARDTESEQDELDHVGQKIKEVTVHCVASLEQTKRLKSTLVSVTNSPDDAMLQRSLYDETNTFLKSIISILAAIKGAIPDIPSLNEVRGSLSNLTRATKELTIRLERSALKQRVLVTASGISPTEQPSLSAIPSVSNFQGMPPQQPQHQQHSSNTSGSTASTTSSGLMISSQHSQHSPSPPLTGNSTPLSPMDAKDALSMKQHIRNHQADRKMQTPLTTPLSASIGPTAASAVLPAASATSTPKLSGYDMEHNPFDKTR